MFKTNPFIYRFAVGLTLTIPLVSLADTPRSEASTSSETMVITATGYEQSTLSAPASISVINRSQIENRAYKDITDALQDVPGVVITSGGSRQEISLRGMPSDYTVILVDGRKQSGRETQVSGGGGYEQDWLPPLNTIERIEVIRGPMSTLYGSDAIGGVINIITRKDNTEWAGQLRAESVLQENNQSGDYYQGELSLSGPLVSDRLSANLSARYQERIEDDIAFANGGKTLENYRASLHFTATDDDTISVDYTHHDQTRENTAGKTRTRDSETNNNRQSIGIGHEASYSDISGSSYFSMESVENVGRSLEVENIRAKTQWSKTLNLHYVSVGTNFEREVLDNGSFEFRNAQWSVFAEDEWYVSDNIALTLGLRYDNNEQFGSHLSPRVYAVWSPSATWAIKGGVSTGYRAPSLTEMEEDWVQESCNGRCDLYGNADLKPESSVNTELGLYYEDIDMLSTSVTVFYNDFEDKIDRVNLDPNCTARACDATYANIEEAITYGSEASVKKALTKSLDVTATYTYTRSEKRAGEDKGQPLTQVPTHLVALNTDWAIQDDIGSWLRVSYRSEESDPISIDSRSQTAPSVTYVDFGTNWQLNRHFKLMAGIYNLLDKQTTYDEYGYVEDGRRYWLAVETSF
ncbi:ligand-gated channel protein [Salinivibrio sp. ML198]|uniref:TonB-dependent receptor domain-containing protein n=1 Tax=Salinivibrio sp. ML198 TaxID=1909458 RepID=UPI000988EB19|nr:TonB-dependent receptor [Salinivibrio sp. ML198]OOE80915.1 ligand-gated channel protein [Salinivibrio sp. ML198]